MINPSLHVNKSFKEQVEKCMNTRFGELTKPFIKTTLSKKIVLALIMFHEKGGEKPKKYFRVLRCVIYTMIENYVCIDYLYCQSKN